MREEEQVDEFDGESTPEEGEQITNAKLIRQQDSARRKREHEERHGRLDHMKAQDSARRFAYLLGLTDLFRHFIDIRAQSDGDFAQIVKEADSLNARNSRQASGARRGSNRHTHRKTEEEEDKELLQDERREEQHTLFTESPAFVQGGEMRDYQVQGLNWMISLYENGINGILADEMGLGKTLQTIAFLGYLRYVQGVSGPHLIAVPKSTLDNWDREFKRWTPEVKVLILQGAKEERGELVKERLLTQDFDVCVTSYEIVLREKTHLKKFAWEYIIIDEAHRIKNEESMLAQIIRIFNSRNRLLITGTPLQNNLHELWALLNFLLPDVFADSQAFDSWFASHESESGNKGEDTVVQQLHKVLRPFLLRRVKADVEKSLLPKKEINIYVGMSEMQVRWYQKILEKDIDAVNGAAGNRESKTRLLNIVMQLRKCCNHPYLFEGAEPGPPYTTDEHLVFNAGKMVMLDRLLGRLREQNSRVLIFSQMSRVLDILEDYCVFRDYKYCRIDGQTAHQDRIAAIDDYSRPDSDKFVFLLTTRAGGLGINLTAADIVVLYDSDWNPQADLQAMDRAHRIGQTKQVVVFRFVTENAIEEKVLERAAQKLRLDQLVIQQGRAQSKASAAANKDDLLTMIQHGAEAVFQKTEGGTMTDTDIDEILKRGEERTANLNARYAKLGLDDLQKFTSDSAYEWNGEDFAKRKTSIGTSWINPTKRERKEGHYAIDQYYKSKIFGGRGPSKEPKAPRAPRQIHVYVCIALRVLTSSQDHQFYPDRLVELQEKETLYYRKQQEYKVPLAAGTKDDIGQREAQQREEQEQIDGAEPLTEEEEKEKSEMSTQGFGNWQRREFLQFITLCGKHGRKNLSEVAGEMDTKTEQEVREYAAAFWKHYRDIDSYDRYISQIEAGEMRTRRQSQQQRLLREKVEAYRAPLQQLRINYGTGTTKKTYSDEEDRFLMVYIDRLGLDSENLYERLREEIRESPLFRFDWFIKSRTPIELQRRSTTLLSTLTKEAETRKGKEEETEEEDDELTPPPKKSKTSKSRTKNRLAQVKDEEQLTSSNTTRETSPATASVTTNGSSRKRK